MLNPSQRKEQTNLILLRIQAMPPSPERNRLGWEVVQMNEGLARWLVKRLPPPWEEDDLSDAHLALHAAALYTDPRKGASLATVSRWYHQRLARPHAQLGIHVPQSVRAKLSRIYQYRAHIEQKEHRLPSIAEALEALDMRADEEAIAVAAWATSSRRGESPLGTTADGQDIQDLVLEGAGEEPPPVEFGEVELERLRKVLATLPPREAEMLLYRYDERTTLREVGKQYGISRERVRQIGVDAWNRLKRHPTYRNQDD